MVLVVINVLGGWSATRRSCRKARFLHFFPSHRQMPRPRATFQASLINKPQNVSLLIRYQQQKPHMIDDRSSFQKGRKWLYYYTSRLLLCRHWTTQAMSNDTLPICTVPANNSLPSITIIHSTSRTRNRQVTSSRQANKQTSIYVPELKKHQDHKHDHPQTTS